MWGGGGGEESPTHSVFVVKSMDLSTSWELSIIMRSFRKSYPLHDTCSSGLDVAWLLWSLKKAPCETFDGCGAENFVSFLLLPW